MKKLSLVLPLTLGVLLFSCGGNKEAEDTEHIDTTAYVVPEDTTAITVNEEIKFRKHGNIYFFHADVMI